MNETKWTLFLSLVVSTIITLQLSIRRAPADATASNIVKPAATQPVASVKIDNFTFRPKQLEIAIGTTVTWLNADDVPHTVTSKDDPQAFASGALDTDDKFAFTFKKPGKYAYYCKVHPHMTGIVIVK